MHSCSQELAFRALLLPRKGSSCSSPLVWHSKSPSRTITAALARQGSEWRNLKRSLLNSDALASPG